MIKTKNNKLILCIIISIVILVGAIIIVILLPKDDKKCKWCDDTKTECHIDKNGKTVCSVIE